MSKGQWPLEVAIFRWPCLAFSGHSKQPVTRLVTSYPVGSSNQVLPGWLHQPIPDIMCHQDVDRPHLNELPR